MKVAVVSDDGKNVSQHFGRAKYFLIYETSNSGFVLKEVIEKPAHNHDMVAHGHHHGGRGHGGGHGLHRKAVNLLKDCQVLIARGLVEGARLALKEKNIEVVITNEEIADEAVRKYLKSIS